MDNDPSWLTNPAALRRWPNLSWSADRLRRRS